MNNLESVLRKLEPLRSGINLCQISAILILFARAIYKSNHLSLHKGTFIYRSLQVNLNHLDFI